MIDVHESAALIASGKVGVIPTDTLYGIVCSALNAEAVERLYKIRERTEHKPCIVLIADTSSLSAFGITLDEPLKKKLAQVWPGPVSVILPCTGEQFAYLHRGTKSLAFRVPAEEKLRSWLETIGPVIAPSANPEGRPPATTIDEARAYFSDAVDFYVEGGVLEGKASTLVEYVHGVLNVVRPGAGKIK